MCTLITILVSEMLGRTEVLYSAALKSTTLMTTKTPSDVQTGTAVRLLFFSKLLTISHFKKRAYRTQVSWFLVKDT